MPEVVEVDPMLRTCTQLFVNDTQMRDLIPVLNLLGHRQESLLDVGRVLRRRLQEGDGELVRELLQADCE